MSRLFSGTPFDRPITCPNCGKAVADCRCVTLPVKKKMAERAGGKHHEKKPAGYELTPENSVPPKDQKAMIRMEKRAGNRVVTVITGLEHPGNDLPKILAGLKSKLGTGGSIHERTMEIQGDQREGLPGLLEGMKIKARVL